MLGHDDMNKQLLLQRLRDHRAKWESVYGLLSQWASILSVMAGFLGIFIAFLAIRESRLATGISSQALAQSQKSVALQESEFRLRNRPYLIMKNPTLRGTYTDADGGVFPHSLSLELHNLSQIPANTVITKGTLFIDGQATQTTEIKESGCAQDDPKGVGISLSDELYGLILSATSLPMAVFTTTYSGMLGENPAAYTSVVTVIYRKAENGFGMKDMRIR